MSGLAFYNVVAQGASVASGYLGATYAAVMAAIANKKKKNQGNQQGDKAEDKHDNKAQAVQAEGDGNVGKEPGDKVNTDPAQPAEPGAENDINTVNRHASLVDEDDEDEWDDSYVPPYQVNRDFANERNGSGVPVEQGQWMIVTDFHRN